MDENSLHPEAELVQSIRLDRNEVKRALQQVSSLRDTVLVLHSSLIHLGCDPAGAKWALLAPLKELASQGVTVALPTFTLSFCEGVPFDPKGSESETGRLGEWLLELEGARRTAHPIYSFAVLGPAAEDMLACSNRAAFGPNSPFALFAETNARIVMLGADWGYCTQFHYSEQRANVPYRTFKTFTGTVSGRGEVSTEMFVRDLEIDARNDFRTAIHLLRGQGKIRSSPLANAKVESVSCVDLASACESLLAKNPLALVADQPKVERALQLRSARESQPMLRLNVLGSRNLALLAQALRSTASDHIADRNVEVWEPDYGQLWQTLLDQSSALYATPAAASYFVDRFEDVLGVSRLEFASPDWLQRVRDYAELIADFAGRAKGLIVVNRFARLIRPILGQAEAAASQTMIAEANSVLEDAFEHLDNVHIFDLDLMAALHVGDDIVDERLWLLGKFPFGRGFSDLLAERYAGLLLAETGNSARLLVIDLDDTLWSGVLGEDGVEGLRLDGDYPGNAHRELQRVLKHLTERGLALAVVSKNDEEHTLQAMSRLQGMILEESDFVAHRINWRPKTENIAEIAAELNLGLEHIAFIDNSPVEREQVRQQLPAVKLIDIPDEPALFVKALLSNPYLECLAVTAEDRTRIKNYRGRTRLRTELRKFDNLEDFYASLDPTMHVYPLDDRNIGRAAQLMAKTNQFNTTTRRYDRSALMALARAHDSEVLVIGLEDRFSELENIGVVVMKFGSRGHGAAEIDDLLLSCRALGRGVEPALIEWLTDYVKRRGMRIIRGAVIDTERNTPAREYYAEHGFEPGDAPGTWVRDLGKGTGAPPPWIKIVNHRVETESISA